MPIPPGDKTMVAAGASGRIFDHARIWQLTNKVFQDAARLLAAAEPRPDIVVGIARGGVPLARFLGAWFRVPVAEIRARHNRGDGVYAPQSGTVTITGRLSADGKACPAVLVADDICGTGHTFRAVLHHVSAQLRPGQVRTMALCRNAGASFAPDAWLWDTRDWVVFPWDRPPSGPVEALAVPPRVRGEGQP